MHSDVGTFSLIEWIFFYSVLPMSSYPQVKVILRSILVRSNKIL